MLHCPRVSGDGEASCVTSKRSSIFVRNSSGEIVQVAHDAIVGKYPQLIGRENHCEKAIVFFVARMREIFALRSARARLALAAR
jgi:hypothetical protein